MNAPQLQPSYLGFGSPAHDRLTVAGLGHDDWFVTDDAELEAPEEEDEPETVGISTPKLVGFGAAFAMLATVTALLF